MHNHEHTRLVRIAKLCVCALYHPAMYMMVVGGASKPRDGTCACIAASVRDLMHVQNLKAHDGPWNTYVGIYLYLVHVLADRTSIAHFRPHNEDLTLSCPAAPAAR